MLEVEQNVVLRMMDANRLHFKWGASAHAFEGVRVEISGTPDVLRGESIGAESELR